MTITYSDRLIKDNAYLAFDLNGNRQQVEFQYAPKVISDSRKGNWDERDAQGTEPIVNYKASTPRYISLQITYFNEGNLWNCDRIRRNINLIRGYFQRVEDIKNRQRNLLVWLRLWCIGGRDTLTFRMKSCDVKYSETMVAEARTVVGQSGSLPASSTFNTAFPLRTDVTIDLASWTKGAAVLANAAAGLFGTKQEIDPAQSEIMPTDWY